jgi:hypothetical protein
MPSLIIIGFVLLIGCFVLLAAAPERRAAQIKSRQIEQNKMSEPVPVRAQQQAQSKRRVGMFGAYVRED